LWRAPRFAGLHAEGFDVAKYLDTQSISISMASASKSLTALILALLGADLLQAQAPAPLRLSFAGAVREARVRARTPLRRR